MAEKCWLVPYDVDIGASASFGVRVALPSVSVLGDPEKFEQECASLTEWEVGKTHKIPSIWTFMSKFGGCTSDGEIFWRLEEKQVVALLLDGWFREAPPGSNCEYLSKKCILVGSSGIGKSTLLCVVAFYLVFKLKKWVLIFRQLAEADCLVCMGYDQSGAVVHLEVEDCTDVSATNIYQELVRQHGMSNVWLFLDNFEYRDVPEGLKAFDMVAASQPVDLMFGERSDEYCCLLPSWSLRDLQLLGKFVYKFDVNVANGRY